MGNNELHFKTFYDLSLCIRKNISMLPTDIDLIVGIPRSGIIPAYIIALFLNKQVCSIDEFVNNIEPSNGERPVKRSFEAAYRVLIVDDSIHSGVSLNKTKNRLSKLNTDKYKFEYLAVYARSETKNMVDYFFEIVPLPRLFQWNYLNHNIVSQSCCDIDGVLCLDPKEEENDDGDRYINFILDAQPLYIPEYKIHSLVTSRLEKYRPQTEEWLRRNNILYDNLYMLDLPSKKERIKRKAHANFKAEIYKKLNDTVLFIESNPKQAEKIAALTSKPCICVETDEIFYGGLAERPSQGKLLHEFDTSNYPLVRKRILLFSHELTYTGAPHSLLRICRMLLKNGFDIEVWSAEDGDFKEEFTKLGIMVRIVPNNMIYDPIIADAIRNFDLAIANTLISHRFFNVSKDLVPTIWYIREAQNIPEICRGNPDREKGLRNARTLYCVSEYAKEYIQRKYNPEVQVVHNCVEDYYQGIENNVEGKINFICAGTLTHRKAFDVYIDAYEQMPQDYQKKSHLYFMGRLIDSRADYWKPLLKRADANDNITYLGEIKDTQEKISLFEKMNVFVVVSRDESCSLIVLEGAMMGKPLIVSENVGAKYMVDENTGWIVKTNSPGELRKVFENIIDNPQQLLRMGKNARTKYLETSTIEIYEKNIMKMVEKNLNCKQTVSVELETAENRLKRIRSELNNCKMDLKLAKGDLQCIHNSVSFKIGRAVTWMPRKIRGGIRCYKENGMSYTINRIKIKMRNLFFKSRSC